MVGIAGQLHDLGFKIVATRGTAAAIKRMGIPVESDQQDPGRLAATSSTGSTAATSTS